MFAKLKPAMFQGLLWQHAHQMCEMENECICSTQWTELKPVLLLWPMLFLLTPTVDKTYLFGLPFGKLQTGRLEISRFGTRKHRNKVDGTSWVNHVNARREGSFSNEIDWNWHGLKLCLPGCHLCYLDSLCPRHVRS